LSVRFFALVLIAHSFEQWRTLFSLHGGTRINFPQFLHGIFTRLSFVFAIDIAAHFLEQYKPPPLFVWEGGA